MNAKHNMARRFAAIVRLGDEAGRVATHVVSRAYAARQLGSTAGDYRDGAQELSNQADRAEKLLFGQAAKMLHAAAEECQLIADALEALEDKGNA